VHKGLRVCIGPFPFKFIKRHETSSQRQINGNVLAGVVVTYDFSKEMSMANPVGIARSAPYPWSALAHFPSVH
jgi:hypothetical protein